VQPRRLSGMLADLYEGTAKRREARLRVNGPSKSDGRIIKSTTLFRNLGTFAGNYRDRRGRWAELINVAGSISEVEVITSLRTHVCSPSAERGRSSELCLTLIQTAPVYGRSSSKPNIVFILIDNLGCGELGVYAAVSHAVQNPTRQRRLRRRPKNRKCGCDKSAAVSRSPPGAEMPLSDVWLMGNVSFRSCGRIVDKRDISRQAMK
jgi:hypothetical protein